MSTKHMRRINNASGGDAPFTVCTDATPRSVMICEPALLPDRTTKHMVIIFCVLISRCCYQQEMHVPCWKQAQAVNGELTPISARDQEQRGISMSILQTNNLCEFSIYCENVRINLILKILVCKNTTLYVTIFQISTIIYFLISTNLTH